MRIGIALILALIVVSPALTITGGEENSQTPLGCQLLFDGDLANESVQFQTSLFTSSCVLDVLDQVLVCSGLTVFVSSCQLPGGNLNGPYG